MSSHRVREARFADAPEIARLMHEFNSEFSEPVPAVEVLSERYERFMAAGEVYVLLGGDGPDGFAQLRYRTSLISGALDAYLEELYVAPAKRGQGLGRALLDAAIELARAHGATRIDLGTSESDAAAIALYESAGFSNRERDGAVMFVYELEI